MTENILLKELNQLPENLKVEALHYIVFLKKEYSKKKDTIPQTKRIFGRVKGKYTLAPDFDAPLED